MPSVFLLLFMFLLFLLWLLHFEVELGRVLLQVVFKHVIATLEF